MPRSDLAPRHRDGRARLLDRHVRAIFMRFTFNRFLRMSRPSRREAPAVRRWQSRIRRRRGACVALGPDPAAARSGRQGRRRGSCECGSGHRSARVEMAAHTPGKSERALLHSISQPYDTHINDIGVLQ
jgi:hypothetical protein